MVSQNVYSCIDEVVTILKREDPVATQMLPSTIEFEWVSGLKGGSRIVATGDGRRFLYRGQNERHVPCLSSVWRKLWINGRASEDRRLNWAISRVRIAEFERLLEQHPAMELAKQNHIELQYDALAQHYGIPTFWLDLTTSIDIASFFAVAKFERDGAIVPFVEGTGVMYRVSYLSFEEPDRYFTSITHSPASRPGRQHGWAVGIKDGVDFDGQEFVERFEFQHSRPIAERIITALATRLFPKDSIASVAKTLWDSNAVTMAGIRRALERDGCPADRIEKQRFAWGELLCNSLGMDIYLDEEFALTEEQLLAGREDAARARETFLSGVGFRVARTLKKSQD